MNIYDYAVVVDFDGTIVTKDSNEMLFYNFGTEETRQIEMDYLAGTISGRSAFERLWKCFPFTLDEYHKFLDDNISLDSGFIKFYNKVVSLGIPFFVVSGGFRQAINRKLDKISIPDDNIYANDLVMDKFLYPVFRKLNSECVEMHGPCGNCKIHCIEDIRLRTGKKILFIGDGFTDKCAVKYADCVFAKSSLIKFCEESGIKYQAFNEFSDLYKQIFYTL